MTEKRYVEAVAAKISRLLSNLPRMTPSPWDADLKVSLQTATARDRNGVGNVEVGVYTDIAMQFIDQYLDPAISKLVRDAKQLDIDLSMEKTMVVLFAGHTWSDIAVRVRVPYYILPDVKKVVRATRLPDKSLSDWIRWQEPVIERYMALRTMHHYTSSMNTVGQVDRLWPLGARTFMPEAMRADLAGRKRRARWPVDFSPPPVLSRTQKLCDDALDGGLLLHGDRCYESYLDDPLLSIDPDMTKHVAQHLYPKT